MTYRPTPAQLAELRALEDAQVSLVREAALKSTWVLATQVLWPDVAHKHYHPDLHIPLTTFVDDAPAKSNRAVIISRNHRKCVHRDVLVTLANGAQKPAGELVIGDEVLAFTQDWKLAPAKVHALADNGQAPSVRVRFRSGREVTVTANHPFKTFFGWTDAEFLKPGDKVPVGAQGYDPANQLTVEESALLGYLVGDGSTSQKTSVRFSNIDKGVLARFNALCAGFGFTVKKYPSLAVCDWAIIGGSLAFARKFGLLGKKSIHKEIPVEVMTAPPAVARAFVGAWYDCDGGINSRKRNCEVRFYTSSPELAHDGLYLLSRLGFSPKLSYRPSLRGYTIHLSETADVRKFFDEVPVYSSKMPKDGHVGAGRSKTYLRCLPKGRHKCLPRPYNFHHHGIKTHWYYETTFDKAREIAEIHPQTLQYRNFQWDQVVEVVDVGAQPTLSIQIEPHNTLLLEGLVTHNTTLLTVAHAVRRILADPEIRILVVTALDDKATEMASLIKKQFQDNEGLAKYFPEFILPPKFGTEYGFTHPLRRSTGLMSKTLTATYLGAPVLGGRCDVLIFDDAISEKAVATPDLTRKVNKFINELIPLVDVSDKYQLTYMYGTPKSYNDYYAIVSGKGESFKDEKVGEAKAVFEVIRRGALENERGEPDIAGEPILPNVYNRQELLDTLEKCRLNPDQGESYFYREYLTLVQAPGDQKFEEAWFDSWVPMLPPGIVWSGISVDKADKDEQILFRGDFSVLLAAHFDSYGNLYLSDGERSNGWKTADRKRALLSLSQRNRNISNYVAEKVGDGGEMGQVRGWFNEARMPLTLYAINVRKGGAKLVRIVEYLQGPLQARKVFFVGEKGKTGFPLSLWQTLKDELTHLGMWSHDDVADALSLFFHPDVRVVPKTTFRSNITPRMTRPRQISTAGNPAMAAFLNQQAAQSRPSLPPIDPNAPMHEQIYGNVTQRDAILDQDGKVGSIDPVTGQWLPLDRQRRY